MENCVTPRKDLRFFIQKGHSNLSVLFGVVNSAFCSKSKKGLSNRKDSKQSIFTKISLEKEVKLQKNFNF